VQAKAFEPDHAVVLLDSDIAAVDVWQLLNSSARWDRATAAMGKGSALVLPAFQLAPPPSVHEGSGGGASMLLGGSLESAVKAAMAIVTAGEARGTCHKITPPLFAGVSDAYVCNMSPLLCISQRCLPILMFNV
jgi:hypothetical protein